MGGISRTDKVYIVDDDPVVRQAIGLILSRSGFETVGLSSGADLMRMMRSEIPHCILLDLKLANESGIDVLRELRSDNHSTPVLIVSGKGSIAEAVASLKLGADDFIQKPFTGAELTNHVFACIAKRAAKATAEVPTPCTASREPLTRREQQVMELCVNGATAKEIGLTLGLSPRTVEEHRGTLMRKLGARSITDMVRIVLAGGAGRELGRALGE